MDECLWMLWYYSNYKYSLVICLQAQWSVNTDCSIKFVYNDVFIWADPSVYLLSHVMNVHVVCTTCADHMKVWDLT